jgi:hypothetical protein
MTTRLPVCLNQFFWQRRVPVVTRAGAHGHLLRKKMVVKMNM